MLVLLPPSEGKTPRRRGRPVRLDALSHPSLTAAREHLLTGLADASAGADAAEVLGTRAADQLVVDCRSAVVAAAWRPTPEVAPLTVAIRVLRDDGGSRVVVSRLAKQTRGLVVRHLVSRSGADPTTPQRLAAVLRERWTVELGPPALHGHRVLDVVLPG